MVAFRFFIHGFSLILCLTIQVARATIVRETCEPKEIWSVVAIFAILNINIERRQSGGSPGTGSVG
jgi:hypothetical protein